MTKVLKGFHQALLDRLTGKGHGPIFVHAMVIHVVSLNPRDGASIRIVLEDVDGVELAEIANVSGVRSGDRITMLDFEQPFNVTLGS